MPKLGEVNSYSISYIRQRGKMRRAGDISLLYEDNDAGFITRVESGYRQEEKKKRAIAQIKKVRAGKKKAAAKRQQAQGASAVQLLVLMPNGARRYVDSHRANADSNGHARNARKDPQHEPPPGDWERTVQEIENARLRHKTKVKGGKGASSKFGTFGIRNEKGELKMAGAKAEMEQKWKQRLRKSNSAPFLPSIKQPEAKLATRTRMVAQSTSVPGLHFPAF